MGWWTRVRSTQQLEKSRGCWWAGKVSETPVITPHDSMRNEQSNQRIKLEYLTVTIDVRNFNFCDLVVVDQLLNGPGPVTVPCTKHCSDWYSTTDRFECVARGISTSKVMNPSVLCYCIIIHHNAWTIEMSKILWLFSLMTCWTPSRPIVEKEVGQCNRILVPHSKKRQT